MPAARDQIRPLTFVFDDDGLVPNSILPLVLYLLTRMAPFKSSA